MKAPIVEIRASAGAMDCNLPGSFMRDITGATFTLVYLARLREVFGTPSEEIQAPPGVTDVATLRAWLASRGGAWAEELAPGRAVRVAVNHCVAQPETPLRPGDEVALFPPVTGG